MLRVFFYFVAICFANIDTEHLLSIAFIDTLAVTTIIDICRSLGISYLWLEFVINLLEICDELFDDYYDSVKRHIFCQIFVMLSSKVVTINLE